jgi:hypothetical protein
VTIFSIQITYLEQWPELEVENTSTLAEATEALKASTLNLPVTSGAQVCIEQIVPVGKWNWENSTMTISMDVSRYIYTAITRDIHGYKQHERHPSNVHEIYSSLCSREKNVVVWFK